MESEIQSRFEALEREKTGFIAELERYSSLQLAFRPAPNAWSMLEVAQHLIISERGIVGSGRSAQLGPITWRSKLAFGAITALFRAGVRVPTVPAAVPKEKRSLEAVRADWTDARDRLRLLLEPLESAALERPAFVHPVAGTISLAQGMEFMVTHITHHRPQLERVHRATGFPKT
jgi:uncharacterized damage-inducible protein DinB